MNILVIDDDDNVREMLQRYIKRRGAAALSASDGRTGLRVLEEQRVDLVITDVNMPGFDGLRVLQAVKDRHPEVPVLVVTGYANKEMAIQAINRGAFALLQKPIVLEDLGRKLDEATDLLRARREERERLLSLSQTAQDQLLRLEREKAFSAAILRNVSLPICLIDRERRIRMANSAFRESFAGGSEVEGEVIERVIRGGELSRHTVQELMEGFPGALIEVRNGSGDEEVRHFQVRGFSVSLADADATGELACLLMQDVTLNVKTEREQALRQWGLKQLYGFRELTAPLVSSQNLLEDVTRRLSEVVGHFNEVLVRLTYRSHTYSSGTGLPCAEPYLTGRLVTHGEEQGRLELFSLSPRSVDVQRELMDELVEVLGLRIEAREFELRLVHSEQLRSLGEMAAGVAHELNQPLSGIRMFSEGMLYGLKNGWDISQEDLRETFEDIVEQVDRMTAIIDHMRMFSRDSSQEDPVAFQIGAVIQNVFKLVGVQLKMHGVAVHVDVSDGLPECRGWPQQIEQVFLNLIVNARQSMDARASLMKAGKVPADPTWKALMNIRAERTPEGVRVAVSDTGGGIPEEVLPRIFEPFFTSKEAGKGTGLGLSISQSIVRGHGGRLKAHNTPGIGATFSVVLPAGGAP